jgi:Zn-dependent M28 family amino/carboxypeptidase
MNIFALSTLLLGSTLIFSAAPQKPLYQVMSSHPHDVKEIAPYIETVKQEGRLWLVQLKGSAPSEVMSHLRRTNGRDVKHYTAPVQKAAFASPIIKDFASRIDAAAIKSDVETLANYKTRLVGSADNQKATAQIKDIFTALGYSVTQYCYRPDACSVVADKAGDGSSDGVIMIMAHLDSVGKNFAGADDNASGAAVLMEVARVLKDYGNKKTLRFFATNGEESGLYGAEHYAGVLKKSGEIKKLVLAINMDMVGYNSNGIVELETDSQYEGLANWFAGLATTYTGLRSKITIGAWGSDHVPFIKGGVPTLLTIEDWSTKTPCYHTECDKPSSLNYEYAAEIAKLNLAAIMSKDAE